MLPSQWSAWYALSEGYWSRSESTSCCSAIAVTSWFSRPGNNGAPELTPFSSNFCANHAIVTETGCFSPYTILHPKKSDRNVAGFTCCISAGRKYLPSSSPAAGCPYEQDSTVRSGLSDFFVLH